MLVIYRMCGIPSTNPSPIFQEDKRKLNEICLRSFVRAFKDVNPKMYFILDHCDATYVDMIERIVPFELDFEMTNIGINETMLMSYDIASKTDQEEILLAECDYLWLEGSGQKILKGIQELGLISPYDNLNFYLDPSIHSENIKLKLIDGQHWRSIERTTMTFGLKRQVLVDNYEIFKKFGYLDNDVWHELRAKGYQMWTPILSLSCHMVRDYLAPGITWQEEWNKYL